MIGFKLTAKGVVSEANTQISERFQFEEEKWTEGDMTILRAAQIASGLVRTNPANAPSLVTTPSRMQGGIFGAVPEKHFAKIKQAKLEQVCALNWDCTLWVSGDFLFTFPFQPHDNAGNRFQRLISLIKVQKEDMGDQVLISVADAILGFATWCVSKHVREACGLAVEIDL